MTREVNLGICEHCHKTFGYWLLHCGFGDCVYSYCDLCGRTSILSLWDKKMPHLKDCPVQQEMCSAMEPFLLSCECGGSFRKGSTPRCPHCNGVLSADLATSYIERNAPGTKVGWRWQRAWSGMYGIVIDEKSVNDNFK